PPVWNLGQRVFLTFAVLIAALALALASPGVDTAPGDPTVAAPRLQLDPNTAPPEVLGALPQVGPTMVHYLIQARRDGPFTSLQDVPRRVRGGGPATIAQLAPYLRFESPSRSQADHRPTPTMSSPPRKRKSP